MPKDKPAKRRSAVNKALKNKPLPGAVATRALGRVSGALKRVNRRKK